MSVVLTILTASALIYLVSVGLYLIFGIMGIINLAHGSFLAMGAYAGVVMQQAGHGPWAGVLLAVPVGAVLGLVLERLLIRRLYHRPLDTILATWGVNIIIIQLISWHFGRGVYFVPAWITGSVSIAGTSYSVYRFVIVGVAALIMALLLVLTQYTDWGLVVRGVIADSTLSHSLGLPVDAVRQTTFVVGAAVGCFSGAVIAPLYSLDPNFGLTWLVSAFLAVMIAGRSPAALGVSALILASVQTLVTLVVSPVAASMAVIVVAVVAMRVLPQGLSGVRMPTRRGVVA